jgi:hypothetical protein
MASLLDGTTFNGVCVQNFGSNTNTLVGFGVGQGLNPSCSPLNNTFFGYGTSCNIEDAQNSTAAGYLALGGGGGASSGRFACHTVAIGGRVMSELQQACRSTAIGYKVMELGNLVCDNVAIGYKTANSINVGTKNVFIGSAAGVTISDGESNVGLGANALSSIVNGNFNVAVGYGALSVLANGARNVAIGYRAGCCIVNADYTISVGSNATTSDANGHTVAGNSSVCSHKVGAVAWSVLSDRRDKTDIEPLENNLGLNFIRNLRPVKFNFDNRQSYVDKCGFEFGIKDNTLIQDFESYGFIAQEIETNIQNLQTHFDALGYSENKISYRVTYDNFIAPIVKSLQQTIERLEYLESKI